MFERDQVVSIDQWDEKSQYANELFVNDSIPDDSVLTYTITSVIPGYPHILTIRKNNGIMTILGASCKNGYVPDHICTTVLQCLLSYKLVNMGISKSSLLEISIYHGDDLYLHFRVAS